MMKPRYFVDRCKGRLYRDDISAQRFASRPDKYREITAQEYEYLTERLKNFADRMLKYQGKHAGKTIHVFGNGPSLLKFAAQQDWTDKLTIGVNAAGMHIKPLTYWLSVDNLWDIRHRTLYDWIGEWLKQTKGKTVQIVRAGSAIEIVRQTWPLAHGQALSWVPDEMFRPAGHGSGLGPAPTVAGGLYWTLSSVQAAVDLARHMAAKLIVMWGVDYHDRSHSYTGLIEKDAKDNPGHSWQDWPRIVEGFEALKRVCKVVNANPDSRLDVFEKVTPEVAWSL